MIATNVSGIFPPSQLQVKPYNMTKSVPETPENNKKINKKILTAALAVAAVSGIYIASRKGNLNIGNKIKSEISETSKQEGEKVASVIAEVCEPDKLPFKIKPPKIDDLTGTKYNPSNFYGEKLEAEYQKIKDDIARDANTQKRYTQVLAELNETAEEISKKFKEILPNEPGLYTKSFERSIPQKRYFSISGNQSSGYCCLDPLLYRTAREEAVDVLTGYHILSPLNQESKSPLLNGLLGKYKSIPTEDLSFISGCAEKLKPEDAICCGHNSVLHAHELSRVGKIFREAMGIGIK